LKPLRSGIISTNLRRRRLGIRFALIAQPASRSLLGGWLRIRSEAIG
jgi:hypothetical protein